MKTLRKPALLVVDDEPDLLALIQISLESKGYDVTTSLNADNLLDIIANDRPSLILIDLQMDGIDGSTICQLLKHNESTAAIPVVILSANENIEAVSLACGANSCIRKPFRAVSVNDEVQRILGRA
jgi:CheY-like chemotaxis protein